MVPRFSTTPADSNSADSRSASPADTSALRNRQIVVWSGTRSSSAPGTNASIGPNCPVRFTDIGSNSPFNNRESHRANFATVPRGETRSAPRPRA